MPGEISIETDHAVSISTDRPVSITSEGGRTTLRIEATTAPRTGLVQAPRASEPAEAMLPEPRPVAGQAPRCGAVMVRSGKVCARIEGHNGVHMSADQIERKQAYNKQRARERYAEDPEYAERVKAMSRASHARRSGGQPAEE